MATLAYIALACWDSVLFDGLEVMVWSDSLESRTLVLADDVLTRVMSWRVS